MGFIPALFINTILQLQLPLRAFHEVVMRWCVSSMRLSKQVCAFDPSFRMCSPWVVNKSAGPAGDPPPSPSCPEATHGRNRPRQRSESPPRRRRCPPARLSKRPRPPRRKAGHAAASSLTGTEASARAKIKAGQRTPARPPGPAHALCGRSGGTLGCFPSAASFSASAAAAATEGARPVGHGEPPRGGLSARAGRAPGARPPATSLAGRFRPCSPAAALADHGQRS